MFPVVCLKETLAAHAKSKIKDISLDREIMLGRRCLCLDIQTAYLKMSMTTHKEPDWSLLVSSLPYKYNFLNVWWGDKGTCPLKKKIVSNWAVVEEMNKAVPYQSVTINNSEKCT